MTRYTCRYCSATWETTFSDEYVECPNCGNVNQRKFKKEIVIPDPPKDQIDRWIMIGKSNPWICRSWDPAFNRQSFKACESIEELSEMFSSKNWSLGVAFYYKNICFINQINGGSEWLVIKDDFAFESLSMGNCSTAVLADYIDRFQKANRKQLVTLEY